VRLRNPGKERVMSMFEIRSGRRAIVLAGLLFAAILFPFPAWVDEGGEEGIEVAPRGVYSIGTAPLGQPLTLKFRLRNPDTSRPLEIRAFQAEAPGFAVVPPAGPIPAGGTLPFQITLLAEEVGEYALPVSIYLDTDPESGLDPLIGFLIEGKVVVSSHD
jgi:hypothetical protein